ncbi:MAG: hypothetical protein R2911_27770 [Caldilineaceae bacterium]
MTALILLIILEHWIYPYRLSTFDAPPGTRNWRRSQASLGCWSCP